MLIMDYSLVRLLNRHLTDVQVNRDLYKVAA